MNELSQLFLEAMNQALHDRTVDWAEIDPKQLAQLFFLAEHQHVFPMIYSAVRPCPAAAGLSQEHLAGLRRRAVSLVSAQANKTMDFEALYRKLSEADCAPLVVKGIVCRELYPQPDQRISGDEDLLMGPDRFDRCAELFLENGLVPSDPGKGPEDYEVAFWKPGSPLRIELHRTLFDGSNAAVSGLNEFFTGAFSRAITVTIGGTEYRTLCHTDHLLFLILHAFKHFLYSGFGIRQVADICLFADAFGDDIDWDLMQEACALARAEGFTAAVFAIGRRHLGLTPHFLPEAFCREDVDEGPLLADLMEGGVYGTASETRAHSSNITLKAVSEEKQGKARTGGLRASLFLPLDSMKRRFPYLEKHPYLLPAAWISRVIQYGKNNSLDDAKESVRLGKERIELLRTYGVLDSE